VRLVLVRHGHAGTKEGWDGDDRLRPLDARGRRQAEHLVEVIVPMVPARLLSSPYLRCLQTMELIAAKTGLAVNEEAALTPNAGADAMACIRELTASEPSGAIVVCTHGEVMGDVLATLAREDGVRLRRRPPGLKGCVWDLDVRKNKVVSARYVSPGR
jgi:8-oxo-(d)GTP phosphatase